jgi:transposase
LTQIWGFLGWKVTQVTFETPGGIPVVPIRGLDLDRDVIVVLHVERRWMGRCANCGARCRDCHERLQARRWADLPWAAHRVQIAYAPVRLACRRCGCRAVELLAWADPHQRQSRRLQQHLALQCASMPVVHVAAQHGLSWSTVHRAEVAALQRWAATRPEVPLREVGVDEKWLGRRNHRTERFVTIVSNLETGEPLWIGYGRREETLASWLALLTPAQKAGIRLFSMDMHEPFIQAIRHDPVLATVPITHDPFHVIKRAGEALDEVRRQVFFRAGPDMRQIGRGKRWLVLRAWERCTPQQQSSLRDLLGCNRQLARAYQLKEELREVLHAPDRPAMMAGFARILRRTQARQPAALRKLHDSLLNHLPSILALADLHPHTGRVEALNNNWEALVRRSRGHRNHDYLLLKLRFMCANPIHTTHDVKRFLALDIPTFQVKAA